MLALIKLASFHRAREAYNSALLIFRRFESNYGDWPVGDTLAKLAALDIEAAAISQDRESRTAMTQIALQSVSVFA